MTARATALVLALGSALAGPALAAGEFVVSMVTVADQKAVFGTIESVHETQARARIAGTLVSLGVVEGDRVRADEVIARVRDPKLTLQLAEVDARIKALQVRERLARTERDRVLRLRRTGAASQAQLDRAETNLEVVLAEIAATRASRAVLAEQEAEGAVLAPADGRVLKVLAIAGTYMMPGEPVATVATQTYVLRLRLPERHARFIKVGDPVLVGARGLSLAPEKRREGRVRLVFPELEQGRVIADVEASGLGDFFVGERTRVWLSTGTRRTFIVPPDYVYRRFGVHFVRLVDGAEVPVQPGQRRAEGLEILSGLRDGDVLVKP